MDIHSIKPTEDNRFNKVEYRKTAEDYLRHAKEGHSFMDNDMKELYNEGSKSPSNALIHLHDVEINYKNRLKKELPRDEYVQKINTMNSNIYISQGRCVESDEFYKYLDSIEKLYKKSWVLRCQLITAGRFIGGKVQYKLPKIIKRLYKKFLPQNIEKTMNNAAQKAVKNIKL